MPKEFNEHLLFVHLRKDMDGEKVTDLTDTCLMCLPCRLCVQEYMKDKQKCPIQQAFICCLSCYSDHVIHETIHLSSPLTSILISLRNEFANNQRALKLVENLFNIECPCCNFLADTFSSLTDHCRQCFAQIMSQSKMFGVPFDTDIFFLSPYIRQKEQEERQSHCLQQIGRFIKEIKVLHPTNFNLSDGEIRSIRSLELTYSTKSSENLPSLPLSMSAPPPSPSSPPPTLKRKNDNGQTEKRSKIRLHSDDEQYLESFHGNDSYPQLNDENFNPCPSDDDNDQNDEPEVQIIKIVQPDEHSNLQLRIKPETSNPDYDRAL